MNISDIYNMFAAQVKTISLPVGPQANKYNKLQYLQNSP